MVKTLYPIHSRERDAQLHYIRGKRITSRSSIRDSNSNSVPNEIIHALHNRIEPSAQDQPRSTDAGESIEIIYEELAPPEIIEIHYQPREPESIEQNSTTDDSPDHEYFRDPNSPMLINLPWDFEPRTSPSELEDNEEINEALSSSQSTIERSPSPSYSPTIEHAPTPSYSPVAILSSDPPEEDETLGDSIPGLLDSIPDEQLLKIMKEFNWTFIEDNYNL